MSEPELVQYFVLLTAGAHLAYDIYCVGQILPRQIAAP